MQLLCHHQLQCNDCGFDRADKVNGGEVLHELSTKSKVIGSQSASFIVMLPSKLVDFKANNNATSNTNIEMIDLDTKQQVQQQFVEISRSPLPAAVAATNHLNAMTTLQRKFPNNKRCNSTTNTTTATTTTSNDEDVDHLNGKCQHFSTKLAHDGDKNEDNNIADYDDHHDDDDNVCRYSWSGCSTVVSNQSNHSRLFCKKHYMKVHRRNDHFDVLATVAMMHQQKCNFISTKLAGETVRTKKTVTTATIGTAHMDDDDGDDFDDGDADQEGECNGCDCSLPFANFSQINKRQQQEQHAHSSCKLRGNYTGSMTTTAAAAATTTTTTMTMSTTTATATKVAAAAAAAAALPSSKTSHKYVNRLPLAVNVHRSNLLQIFIKYLLILNCFVCVASGNLMTRNHVGNDLSNKHNQSSVENAAAAAAANTPLDSTTTTTSLNGRNKQILTTPSPHILHSIMSSNRSQLFGGADLQSQENSGGQRQARAHFAHQHLTSAGDAMPPAAAAFYAAESTNSHQMPNNNNDDGGSEEFSRCASCQMREQLKAQNLASIKMHILARLSMTHPPNITQRPKISEQILENFYQNNGFRYIRVRNDSNEFDAIQRDDMDDGMNEMQGDDPNASATSEKHQHHHLHEYHRNGGNGGGKSGLHEQHHHHQSSYHHHNRHSRLENEYNEEYDYSERGGIVFNMDYYDEPRSSSTRLHYDEMPYDSVEDVEEAFYSTTDVIYSFPKLSKARHRGDILEFTIKNKNHLSVDGATFNLFVRGEDWMNENEPNVWTRSGSSVVGESGGVKSNPAGIHIDAADKASSVSGSGTVTATATPSPSPSVRDEHGSFSGTSDSFHKLHSNSKNVNNNHISISINRFVHRHQQQQNTNDQEQSKKTVQPTQQQPQQQQQQQQRYTRIDSNFVGEIPKGAGEWIQFNITLMVSEWIQQQQQKHQSVNPQSADIVQEVVIKTLEPWMRQLLVLDTNSKNRPYIEIQTRDMRKHRTKRHLAKDCRENEKHSRCCRYPLRVDFREFGWDWIIAPDIYEAYYCAGECPIGFLPKHPHTYIYSLSSSYSTCCSPRKLSPISLLYFGEDKNIIHSTIPNMAVEKCGCS